MRPQDRSCSPHHEPVALREISSSGSQAPLRGAGSHGVDSAWGWRILTPAEGDTGAFAVPAGAGLRRAGPVWPSGGGVSLLFSAAGWVALQSPRGAAAAGAPEAGLQGAVCARRAARPQGTGAVCPWRAARPQGMGAVCPWWAARPQGMGAVCARRAAWPQGMGAVCPWRAARPQGMAPLRLGGLVPSLPHPLPGWAGTATSGGAPADALLLPLGPGDPVASTPSLQAPRVSVAFLASGPREPCDQVYGGGASIGEVVLSWESSSQRKILIS